MVELLSPAGEYDSFLGAINAGADAIYLAGNMYGARASAVNFTCDEIIKAIKYAHLFGRKVYLTVNTLTKNEEIDKLYDFLRPLYLSGLDAVIVQDIGVFLYIKENFKDLDIHVSTQAVITSSFGASFYKDLGAKRVVLARELTLNEIALINRSVDIETECFIHGAMCYSYSGMCLFSSFLGGNSGNRGRCKGPCRQPYKYDSKEAYYLSLSDMNTLDIIDKLIDSGIDSFKIEGRLKSPSYSAGVTHIYRKYIDKYLEDPKKELIIDPKDKEMLSLLYSRTSSGRGYYERISSKNMITFEKGAYKIDEGIENEVSKKFLNDRLKNELDFEFYAVSGEKAYLKAKTMIDDTEIEKCVYSDECIEKAVKEATKEEEILGKLIKLGNTDHKLRNYDITLDDGFVSMGMINNMRRKAVEMIDNAIDEHFEKVFENRTKENIERKRNDFCFDDKQFKTSSCEYVIKIALVDRFDQFLYVLNDDRFDSIIVSKNIAFDERFFSISENSNKNIYIQMPSVLRSLNTFEFDRLIDISNGNDRVKGLYLNQYDAYYYLKKKGYVKELYSDMNIYSYNDIASSFNSSLFESIYVSSELSLKDINDIKGEDLSLIVYGKAPLMHTANCIRKTSGKCKRQNLNDHHKNNDAPKGDEFIYIKDRLNVSFPVKIDCSPYLCENVIFNSRPTSLPEELFS